jgi:serine protease Do
VESGDIITAVNGQSIKDARELARLIGGLAPGSAVKLDMLSKGKSKVVKLTLGQLPNAQEAKADIDTDSKSSTTDVPRLGMTVAPAGKVEGAGQKGVVVTKVEPKSAAADRGFKKGDVILEVAGKSVATPSDVREAIESARTDKKNSVLMRLRSGDASRYVAVPLANG